MKDPFSQAGIRGAKAGKALREAAKQFSQFEKAIKNMLPLLNIPFSDAYIKHHEENMNGFSYLSYCGIKITEEVINEIDNIRETTVMTFSEACHWYVNNLSS